MREERYRVLLCQLPVPNNPALNTPLAAGYLKAYAESQGLGAHVAIEILPRAIVDQASDSGLVAAIVAQRPDLLAISLYTWNSERSLLVAARAKAALPGLRVLIGGPEVQADNAWVLEHAAVDLAVVGEGEQVFSNLLWALQRDTPLAEVAGLYWRTAPTSPWQINQPQVALNDLALVPSPYLGGHVPVASDELLMIEISRWCPYACSFCLYGRNMGAKLGSRYFDLERVLAEIAWGRERGVRQVHFVEANLNLVPLFWPLMRALAELNADHQMTFYAELRGEHLTEAVVAALNAANVRYVEVGLQTANLVALKASHRRTDLAKWAAGTRRLYAYQIEVYLDVIIGLPADDAAGVAETLDFLRREELGSYDIFTLQVLPGTAVRSEAARYDLRYQQRPPYYVLGTDRLTFAELRGLRRELKQGAGLDPTTIEGAPAPRLLREDRQSEITYLAQINAEQPADLHPLQEPTRLAQQLDLWVALGLWPDIESQLAPAIEANPSMVIDLYLDGSSAESAADLPPPEELRAWRERLPFQAGYLDRVAVYQQAELQLEHSRFSPRLWLIVAWHVPLDPAQYAGLAEIIWAFTLPTGTAMPLGAWRAAGGAGIALRFTADAPPNWREERLAEARAWAANEGRMIWAL